jgi:maltose/moltooligosaccharide transporter
MTFRKPHLSLWQILQMNFGFFGIQYSFGLQQANMSPIYQYLRGRRGQSALPVASRPHDGFVGTTIDRRNERQNTEQVGPTHTVLLIGALLCSICLLFMPFSPTLWFAASLLWILDAANNVTMEPYRAYVSDRLNKDQHALGFLTQSAFTGLAQTFAYLTPDTLCSQLALTRTPSTAATSRT